VGRIVVIKWRSLVQLADVFCDAVLPLWRLLGMKGAVARHVNIAIVIAIGTAVFLANAWCSPYQNVETVFVTSTEVRGGHAPLTMLCGVKAVLGVLVIGAILAAFLLDVVDAVRTDSLGRFVFVDGDEEEETRIVSGVLFLIGGYVVRLWLFGIVSLSVCNAVNTASVIACAREVTPASVATPSNSYELFVAALEEPLGPQILSGQATGWGAVALLVVIVGRWLIITLGISTFYMLIPKLATREIGKVPTAESPPESGK